MEIGQNLVFRNASECIWSLPGWRTPSWSPERAGFGLLRGLVDRALWEAVLKGKEVQEGQTSFKDGIVKAQEPAVPMC